MTPYFSIILPVYNRELWIKRAVQSILDQSFKSWELIIIDDASNDNTPKILLEFKDDRIKIYRNEQNLERCLSRNKGIELAKGKYICFLDSDDYHLSDHLEKFYNFIQQKSETTAFFFSNSWNETLKGERTERNCPVFKNFNPYTYFLRYTVNPQRWVVHHKIFEKVKFDSQVIICEDMDTSLRILNAGFPIHQMEERTTIYFAAPDSFTHGDSKKAEKELYYLKKIFSKPELKGKLPKKEKNRLLSMCHYHLAVSENHKMNSFKTIKHAIHSFILFPKSYNGQTNKILLVLVLYNLPFIGRILKNIMRIFKNG